MSSREDIIDLSQYGSANQLRRGLIYLELLGWIDLGHARGDDIRDTLFKMSCGEASGAPWYLIQFEQMMSAGRISTGRYVRWNIKKGRSLREQHSIMLAMLLQTARAFENWQSQHFFNWYTDSGFSGEDLVSDLLGFYRVVAPRNYWQDLKPVSREAALRRWDFYGPVGNYKNRSFIPLLFPDPQEKFIAHKPFKGKLPFFMRTIEPFTAFDNGTVCIIDRAGIINKLGKVVIQ